VAGFFVVRAGEALWLACLGLAAHLLLATRQGWGPELGTFAATSLLVCIFINLFATRLRQDNRRLYLDSTLDSLTGSGNRRLLDDVLAELPDEADSSRMSLLMLDVDRFKSVNDQFGHAIGDLCLNRLAHLLMTDLQPPQKLFRYGGEEFVVLTPGSAQDAAALAERLRSDVEHTQLIRETKITVSIGIASRGLHENVHDWMRRADDAMYQAKQQGRNRCCTAP
jgi:diguanylate cyclase (GGDEF)-like protein